MAKEEINNSPFLPKTVPFDSHSLPPPSSTPSLRHLDQHHLLPPQTPYYNHDSIESLLSGLSISQQNGHHNSHQGFNNEAFAVSDRSFVGSQAFVDQNMGQNLYNNKNSVNSFVSVGLQDYYSNNSASASPTSNIWDKCVYDLSGLSSSNVNGIGISRARGISDGSHVSSFTPVGSASGVLHNRRPYWLQENYTPPPQSYLQYINNNYNYNQLRGGGSSNLEHIVPLPLDYLVGRIVWLAKDQNGCKLVQKTLDNPTLTHEEIDLFLFEVLVSIHELMPHPFGNYVVQKLLQVSSDEQRTMILLAITTESQLVTICLNMHGTRAVQKLLEVIASRQHESIIARRQISIVMSALSLGAVDLAKDMNGQHVIKFCLDHFLPEDNKYLLKVVADNCYSIAVEKAGCCVLQHCIARSTGEMRDRLLAKLLEVAPSLSQDKYGNYVVQYLLAMPNPQITASILRQLKGSFAYLACDKFGSNVVEKCLEHSKAEQSTRIISELLESLNFSMLLVDPYGNFVIQSALKVSKGPVLRALLERIGPNVLAMRNNIYGRKILVYLHKERMMLSM